MKNLNDNGHELDQSADELEALFASADEIMANDVYQENTMTTSNTYRVSSSFINAVAFPTESEVVVETHTNYSHAYRYYGLDSATVNEFRQTVVANASGSTEASVGRSFRSLLMSAAFEPVELVTR
jgi:asparagine N-glycosylation enzyme membrane subunit Stt3